MALRPSEDERTIASGWLAKSIVLSLGVLVIGMVGAWPAQYFTQAATPAQWWQGVEQYGALLFQQPDQILAEYVRWFKSDYANYGRPPVAWIAALGLGVVVFVVGMIRNPYSFDRTEHGSARVSTFKELKKAGLFADSGIVLGWWENTKRPIRNWETLSALNVAPPGTGKTVGLVANILSDWPDRERARLFGLPLPWTRRRKIPGPCMIINDPKGEIEAITAGYRSTLGPVFSLNWGDPKKSARWNPLSPISYFGGEECRDLRAEIMIELGEIYVEAADAINTILVIQRDSGANWGQIWADAPECAAQLSEDESEEKGAPTRCLALVERLDNLQALMSMREQHIARMCTILIPDTVEAHWRDTGRTLLSGGIAYLISHCERLGEEPTFGRLLDELNKSSVGGQGFSDPVMSEVYHGAAPGEHSMHEMAIPGLGNVKEPSGGDYDVEEDLMGAILGEWIDECIAYGYPDKIRSDLQETKNKPDRERGSVVSTVGASINVFKNSAVRAVTSGCSFRLRDIRGIDGKPTTFYFPINLADAEVFGRVTGLFFETVAAWGISQPEKDIKKTRPILMIADEFWTLPPLQSLLQIPALGRGQWFQVMIVGQSYGQIGTKYRTIGGDSVIDTLKASTSYKIIPTQADLKTAKEVSETIGNKTVLQTSVSDKGGLASFFSSESGRNISRSYTGKPLFPAEKIMSMEKLDPTKKQFGWQIVLVLGMMNRPIECRPASWFRDPRLKKRAGLPVKQWPSSLTEEQQSGRKAVS